MCVSLSHMVSHIEPFSSTLILTFSHSISLSHFHFLCHRNINRVSHSFSVSLSFSLSSLTTEVLPHSPNIFQSISLSFIVFHCQSLSFIYKHTLLDSVSLSPCLSRPRNRIISLYHSRSLYVSHSLILKMSLSPYYFVYLFLFHLFPLCTLCPFLSPMHRDCQSLSLSLFLCLFISVYISFFLLLSLSLS